MKAALTSRQIIQSLGTVSKNWLDPKNHFRHQGIRCLKQVLGYSDRMAGAMLDDLFSEYTQPKLKSIFKKQKIDPACLDDWVLDRAKGVYQKARGPKKIFHLLASNSPQSGIVSLIRGLLVKSQNQVKVSRKDSGLIRWYVESIRHENADLAKSISWAKKADKKTFKTMTAEDLLVVYGSDETIQKIIQKMPPNVPIDPYGHRVSMGLVVTQGLDARKLKKIGRGFARDIWMIDQKGCLSPQTIFVQTSSEAQVKMFANSLVQSLQHEMSDIVLTPERKNIYHKWLKILELRKLKSKGNFLIQSPAPGRWLIGCEQNLSGLPFCDGHGVVLLKRFQHPSQLEAYLKPYQSMLQCFALEAKEPERLEWSHRLTRWGVRRVCLPGRMQKPEGSWHPEGRGVLASWLRFHQRKVLQS